MFRWFMIIGVAIIVFSVLVQSRINDVIKPGMGLQPVAVEATNVAPVEEPQVATEDNTKRPAQAEERLRNRVPPKEGDAVSGENIPM
jgi:hypothetical protein